MSLPHSSGLLHIIRHRDLFLSNHSRFPMPKHRSKSFYHQFSITRNPYQCIWHPTFFSQFFKNYLYGFNWKFSWAAKVMGNTRTASNEPSSWFNHSVSYHQNKIKDKVHERILSIFLLLKTGLSCASRTSRV